MNISNVLLSDAWGNVGPDSLNKGIGGREGALIYLSRAWARQGHKVTNFVNTSKGKRFEEDGGGFHEYLPLYSTKPILANLPFDAVVAWEVPSVFDEEEIRENVGLKICEMQVAHLSEDESTAASKYCDYMAVLSDWHGDLIHNSGLDMPKEKFVTLPNGVDISKYPKDVVEKKFSKKIGKNVKFIYSSSPDRGLWYLLQIWPYIRKEFSEAELLVCYGAKKWIEHIKWSHGRVGEMALELEILLDQPGVKDLGKIGQDVLAKLQLEADAWIYPLDSIQSTETGCISAIENAAAGNPIITTDCDCMESEFGDVGVVFELPFEAEDFAGKTIEILNDLPYIQYLRETAREFAEQRDWEVIALQWERLFNE
jgi:glycosyltransferase involved in cell wall biosynthesis